MRMTGPQKESTASRLCPNLPAARRKIAQVETPADFMTALYAGGSSMAIVGASDFKPVTDAYRVLYLVNSLVGCKPA
jgi:hypothetical protein